MTGPSVDGTKYSKAGWGDRDKIPAANAATKPILYPIRAYHT
uniref:Uncharacterized protein n=1 Tax=Arundo donax TaxID=35708 RepID=A0A0A9H7F6_ARUDO